MSFHEVRFPVDISRGASGGPSRSTEVVVLGSGAEERNQRWADSRRRYQAGYGVKEVNDLYTIITFFEERRGKLHGFRWKDWSDFRSGSPNSTVTNTDQSLGLGDGVTTEFQLIKTYGSLYAPWNRVIKKPVEGTVVVAVDGVAQIENTDYTIDYTTGLITFETGSTPGASSEITVGYEFDVPVRFDTDTLSVNLELFTLGEIFSIPIVEIRV